MPLARTNYARSGDVHIAYQVVGEGSVDLVYIPGFVSHVELAWEEPDHARFLSRLASFSRLILFDKRGTGLSDRVPNDQLPNLETRMDDLRAVMDAAGSDRAAVFGFSEGSNLGALFAATYPSRTTALVMYGSFAKRIWSPDYPWGTTLEARQQAYNVVEREWGSPIGIDHYVPSKVDDKSFIQRYTTYLRHSASPGAAVALLRMNTEIDIREVLPTIQVPALVIHRTGDREASIEEGRWIANRIPGALFTEVPGIDHTPWVGDQDAIVDEVQKFLTGKRPMVEISRVLATILFTDIVASTQHAHKLGDQAWKILLEKHDFICRECIGRFRGQLIKSTGDGVHATFDGPGRAIACAQEILESGKDLGIEIRAGLHTGECELRDEEVEGVAVHLAARVAAVAGPGEVLVSRTVRDLVAGSGIEFIDRGDHKFHGFPDSWQVFAVG